MQYPATEDSIPKLKEYIINSFLSVFKKSTPFKAMSCKPVHIYLKPEAVPHAVHVPIPISIYSKDQVKSDIENDIADGILEAMPTGKPGAWCSPMVGWVEASLSWISFYSQRRTRLRWRPFLLLLD